MPGIFGLVLKWVSSLRKQTKYDFKQTVYDVAAVQGFLAKGTRYFGLNQSIPTSLVTGQLWANFTDW